MNSYMDKIDYIKDPALKNFTIDAIKLYSNEYKLKCSNSVCDVLFEILERKNLLDFNKNWVWILISSCYIFNSFFDYEQYKFGYSTCYEDLFKARRVLNDLCNKHKIPNGARDALFQSVEGQLGSLTPINVCKPNLGTPTEWFALAVFIYFDFLKEHDWDFRNICNVDTNKGSV